MSLVRTGSLPPVAVLAGGLATRLGSEAAHTPKSLIEVDGRPFAEHQLLLLRDRGIRHLVWCVGHLGEQIVAALGDGRRFGLHIEYSFDGPTLLGTGGALLRARPLLGPVFLVLYGDSYLECDYQAVTDAFNQSQCLGLMTVFRNDNRWDTSNVRFEQNRILAYDKRAPVPSMHHIDYGLGMLDTRALSAYAPDVPLDLATCYQDLLRQRQLAGFEVNTRFYEIGSSHGLAETRRHLASTRRRSPSS